MLFDAVVVDCVVVIPWRYAARLFLLCEAITPDIVTDVVVQAELY